MASVLAGARELTERHNADSTVQQLAKKLRRSASDSQIRYSRV